MGILAKLTPGKKKASGAAVAPAATPTIVPGTTAVSYVAVETHAPTATVSDDEPTIFTTFMIVYYGFFGLSLLIHPYVFAASYNPLPYWTSMSDELAFAFRITGGAFLTLVLGPFMDEMFGGVGVVMSAFTRQLVFANTAIFLVFLYYSFYAPIATIVVSTWQAQTALAGLILAWNLIEAVGVEALVIFYARYNAAQYGLFGLTLISAPSLFFGPPSPVAYWSEWGELALMAGRGLGVGLTGVVLVGYYYHGAALCKLLTAFNVLNVALFAMPAFYAGASAVVPMWQIQLMLTLPLVVVGVYIEVIGATGPWSLKLTCPAWGANLETFNFVNALWFVPFVIGFYVDPSLFGPSTPTGLPMFLEEFNETSTWFCRAWVTTMLVLLCGPYVLGLSQLGVAKQFTFVYAGILVLFVYQLVATDVMNVVIVAPCSAVNALFFGAGLYLCLPAQSGQPLL